MRPCGRQGRLARRQPSASEGVADAARTPARLEDHLRLRSVYPGKWRVDNPNSHPVAFAWTDGPGVEYGVMTVAGHASAYFVTTRDIFGEAARIEYPVGGARRWTRSALSKPRRRR
jgi:hypothetical protein